MRIIGTSGHVDHGKSLLIKALSNINPMHLPAEKERGMTIDLGFAYLESPQGVPIGIVDVPGHEKFIRNMVAGIWSLDCVLLVVALDDGVMPMTKMHLQIVRAMGVEKIILVANKIDLYSPQEREERLKQILSELPELPSESPHVMVSSFSGEGIEELKQVIFRELDSIAPKGQVTPQYYIDRAFDIKGSGQVVTGSLVGGSLEKNQDLWLYPGATPVSIKNLQAYHQQQELVFPKSRVSLTLKTAAQLKRGMMLSSLEYKEVVSSAYFVVKIEEEYQTLKNYSEVEIALGTAFSIGIMSQLTPGYLFLESREPLAALPTQAVLLISHGGSTLLAHTSVLLGLKDKKQRNWMKDQIKYLQSHNINVSRLLLLCLMNKGILENSFITDEIAEYGVTLKEYFVLSWVLEDIKKQIAQAVQKNKGIKSGEIASRLQFPIEPLEDILEYCVAQSFLVKDEQGYYPQGTQRENQQETLEKVKLNLGEKNAFAFAKNMGVQGFKAQEVTKQKASLKDLKNLVALGLVVFLEEENYMSMEAYEKLEKQILQNAQIGDKFSIQYVKEKTGLSRKYSIPVLNLMEKRGYVKRADNERIVIKI